MDIHISYPAVLLGCGQRMDYVLKERASGRLQGTMGPGLGHNSTGVGVARVRDKHQNRLEVD